jgi:hypothetical protein
MSAISPVVELEGQAASSAASERRWAVLLAFALCLAVGGALIPRDGPAATAPRVPELTLPAGLTDVVLFTFPDRLANEAPPPFLTTIVHVRSTEGLAYVPVHGGDISMLTWTEHGTAYWLLSKNRDVFDLARLANSLR